MGKEQDLMRKIIEKHSYGAPTDGKTMFFCNFEFLARELAEKYCRKEIAHKYCELNWKNIDTVYDGWELKGKAYRIGSKEKGAIAHMEAKDG